MDSEQQNQEQPFDVSEPAGASDIPSPEADNDKTMAGLCYIITVIVPLIILFAEGYKNNKYLRYHALNSLGLCVAAVIFAVLLSILSLILGAIFPPLACLISLLYFAIFLPFIWYAIQAFQGKSFEIPYLTKFLRQQSWL